MRKVVLGPMAALALAASLIAVGQADHYVYNPEDPDFQRPDKEGIENYAFKWWAVFRSLAGLWWADPAIRSDVNTALNNWGGALPQLRWMESTTGETGADVVVRSAPCPGHPEFVGCTFFENFEFDGVRNASYWTKATIYIDPTVNFSAPGRRGTIAHEIGHTYGLEDRYFQPPPPDCNFTETTVMDTGFFAGDNLRYHCDGLEGPSATDVDRVNAFWSQGEFSSFTAFPFWSVGRYRYKNDAWAAYEHRLVWQYWTDQNPGVCCWVTYFSKTRTEGVGIHRLTGNRVFTEVVNAANYGVPFGWFWHIECGQPFFHNYNVLGTWRCFEPQILLDTDPSVVG